MMFILFLVIFIHTTICQELVEQAPLKWAIIQGDVVGDRAGSADTIIESIASFEECVAACNSTDMCIVALRPNATAPCYLYAFGTELVITSRCASNESQLAIRVHTTQPTCQLNAENVINGRTYIYNTSDPDGTRYRIDTDQKGWRLTYPDPVMKDSQVCGGYKYSRPVEDSCSNNCLTTWVQFYGRISETSSNIVPFVVNSSITTWDECLHAQVDDQCLVKLIHDGVCSCIDFQNDFFVWRAPSLEGINMAMRFELDNETCLVNTDQLLRSRSWVTKYYAYTLYVDQEKIGFNRENAVCALDYHTYQVGLCQKRFDKVVSQNEARAKCEAAFGRLIAQTSDVALTSITGDKIGVWVGMETSEECQENATLDKCKGPSKYTWTTSDMIATVNDTSEWDSDIDTKGKDCVIMYHNTQEDRLKLRPQACDDTSDITAVWCIAPHYETIEKSVESNKLK